jgi:large subunit ribosomal protein L16
MLAPKRSKHRKQFRGTYKRLATSGNKVNFGRFGLVSQQQAWITDRQIESCRVVLSRETRKIGRYWLRVFPHKPYTKKPLEVGMGGGKGDISHYVATVLPGSVMFELDGVSQSEAKRIFKKVSHKLPVKTIVIDKNNE